MPSGGRSAPHGAPRLDAAVAAEARDLLGSARELLCELAEEGLESFERVALPDDPDVSAATASASARAAGDGATATPAARAAGAGAGETAPPPANDTSASDARAQSPGGAGTPPDAADAGTSVAGTSDVTSRPEPARPASPAAGAASLFAPELGRDVTLEAVREELGDCTRCRLHEGRRQIVFGDGNPEADLMFVGEGPGEQEDLRGIPFCGKAGDLLTAMIERGLEIPRADVYICNVVKCRPPGNRTPLADEVATCRTFLDGQIDAIRPRVIVALGKPAASLLLGRDVPITKVRGTWHEYRGVPVMPTFHPAYLLRSYTQQNRRAVWNDLRAALARTRE